MIEWKLIYRKRAKEDYQKIKSAGLGVKVLTLLDILKNNPFQNPPPYEKLIGDLKGLYSRRINVQHRLVYRVEKEIKVVVVVRMWTHYQ
jgi:Txe/YoeB family toxin of toxin-antitoxin system